MLFLKKLLSLSFLFLKFGLFSFGGGGAFTAIILQECVEKRKLISRGEVLDIVSIGRSLPGASICNIAMLYGSHFAGVAGGVVCCLSVAVPPFAVLAVITAFYTRFSGNVWVIAAMSGVRAAVVPIIFYSAYLLVKGSYRYPPCAVISAVSVLLYLFFGVSCVYLVILGGIAGFALCEYYERREGRAV